MPFFEVISGESTGTNGNSPKKKRVWAKDFDCAAYKAPILGGGKLISVTPYNYDEEERRADYNATTDKNRTFAIHVQHLWWLKRFTMRFLE
jgi:hypothetical protein